MKVTSIEKVVSEARKRAKLKLAKGMNADEFVEIGNADGFKLYITVGKTADSSAPQPFHQNPRDVFMLLLKGEVEVAFRDRKSAIAKSGQCFVLPKKMEHQCTFKKLTVAVEGVCEKGL